MSFFFPSARRMLSMSATVSLVFTCLSSAAASAEPQSSAYPFERSSQVFSTSGEVGT